MYLLRQLVQVACPESLQHIPLDLRHLQAHVIIQHLLQMRQHDLAGQQRVIVGHVRLREAHPVFQLHVQPLLERLRRDFQRLAPHRRLDDLRLAQRYLRIRQLASNRSNPTPGRLAPPLLC